MKDRDKNVRWIGVDNEEDLQELSNDVFISVTSLYAQCLLDNPLIRGGDHYHCQQAEATKNDFCCDVVLKARRALGPYDYGMWQRLGCNVESSISLSAEIKSKLRLAWRNLVVGYISLFKPLQKEWNQEARRLRKLEAQRKTKALDDNAFSLYEEERKAVELLETQEEINETP
jgi:hypothetical protein